jgi:predicted nucleic acid-binding protein
MGAFAAAAMKAVFVDASFWIALRDCRDPKHREARNIGARVAAGRRPLVSTHLVFAEIHAYFSRFTILRQQVIRDFWSGGVAGLESAVQSDYQEALSLLGAAGDKDYSFCDAVSFAVMRRLGLSDVVSFDGHFRQIGEFNVL